MSRKVLKGVVVSKSGDKTVSVKVVTYRAHTKYHKGVKIDSKYASHDPENKSKVGDEVSIMEARPLSRTKRWEVVY